MVEMLTASHIPFHGRHLMWGSWMVCVNAQTTTQRTIVTRKKIFFHDLWASDISVNLSKFVDRDAGAK